MNYAYKSYKSLDKKLSININLRSIAILPIGCIEQHGPFLPIETDSLIADGIASELYDLLKKENFLIYKFMPIHYTPTKTNKDYQGTVSVNEESFRNYLVDICNSILFSKFDCLVLVSTHSPANNSIIEIVFNIMNKQFQANEAGIKPIVLIKTSDFNQKISEEIKFKSGRHADWREFLMLYKLLGDKYFTDELIFEMREFSKDGNFEINKCGILGIPVQYRSVSGIIGDPFPIDESFEYRELSEKVWKIVIENSMIKISEDLSSFEEICKKRKKL